MPWPTKGESKQHYISHAIPEIMSDKGKDSKQAAAQAYGMWGEKKPAGHKGHRKVRRHRKHEAFATMGKVTGLAPLTSSGTLFSIYKNPTNDELQQYAPEGARGWISPEGDLYLEGYERENHTQYSQITHSVLLRVLKDEGIIKEDLDHIRNDCYDGDFGITIQREGDASDFYIGESVHSWVYTNNKEKLDRLCALAKERNPDLNFYPICIYSSQAERNNFIGTPPKSLSEKFATMARIRPKMARESFLMSLYLNPDQDEMKKYVAIGARGFLCGDGDLYLEGYEEKDGQGNKRQTSCLHGLILQALEEYKPSIFGGMSWERNIWGNVTNYGITIQRYGDTNTIHLGELLSEHPFGKDLKLITQILAHAREKNPRLDFQASGTPYQKDSESEFSGFNDDNDKRFARRIAKTRTRKPVTIHNKFAQGVFEEKFVTMERTGHEGGWGHHVSSVLMSIYLNPTPDEVKSFIADGSRGYVTADGDLYMEGYEKEEGGSKRKSSVVHGAVLQALQRFNPKLIKSVEYEWENTTHGVTIQRWNSTNIIFVGQRVYLDNRKDKERVAQMFKRAQKKNPHFEFIVDLVDDKNRNLPGEKIPKLVRDLAPKKKPKPKMMTPQPHVYNKFLQGTFEEKFVTMAHATIPGWVMGGKPKTILFSIYKNPDSDETRRFVAVGARGFITTNGDMYLEGYEDPDSRAQGSQIMHGPLLEVLRDMGILRDVDGAWGKLVGGVSIQRYGETNRMYLGESLDSELLADLSQEEYDARVTNVLQRAKEKNPKFDFDTTRIDAIPDAGQFDADYLGKYGTLAESFVTMARYRPRSGGSVLLSIYKNPEPDEMRRYIADGSRGFISNAGDLYMEGYEDDEGGSGKQSSIMHNVLLKVLQDHDPKIVPDVMSSWGAEPGEGITIQRWGHSNEIYFGESVECQYTGGEAGRGHLVFDDPNEKEYVKNLLKTAQERNPQLQFFFDSIAVKGWGNGRGLGSGLAGTARLTDIDDTRSEDEIEMEESVIREGIDLSHAYPTRTSRYDSPDTPHYDFETETGVRYQAMFNVEGIYAKDDSPKTMAVLFGTVSYDMDDNEDFSYDRVDVGPRVMYRVLATIVKLVLEKLNEDPLILALEFSADKGEDKEHHNSRQRSYRTMAAQLAKYLEWNYAVTGNSGEETYYIVCPQLSEEAIETMLARDMGFWGEDATKDNSQIDHAIVDQLRGKITEKFVTMQRVYQADNMPSLLLSVYLNPDREEMRKYVASGARGFITTDGDLYVEGYENIDNDEKPISQIDHRVFLEALQRQGIISDVRLAWRALGKGGGVTVQRNGETDEIYIGESYEDITKSKYVHDVFELAKAKNPNIEFIRKQITSVTNFEALTNWDNLDDLILEEGISKKYYFKKGGPTRYQNVPNSFDDIEAGKAGPELAKGFDLNKREVRYLGPVVRHADQNDHLPSHLHESSYDNHLGDVIEWDTLRGEKHRGPVVEFDGNIAFVDCELCGKQVALEDGTDFFEHIGKCPVCNGTGKRTKRDGTEVDCTYCDGLGKVERLKEGVLDESAIENATPYPTTFEDDQFAAPIENTPYYIVGAFVPLEHMAQGMFRSLGMDVKESYRALVRQAKIPLEETYNFFFEILKRDNSEAYLGAGDEEKAPQLLSLAGRIFSTAIQVLKEHMNEYPSLTLVSVRSPSRTRLYRRLVASLTDWSVRSEFEIEDCHFIVITKNSLREDTLTEFFKTIEEDGVSGGVGLSGDFAAHAPEHMIGLNGVPTSNRGTGNTKHGKIDDNTWNSAYTRTRSEDYLRTPVHEARYEKWPFEGNTYAEGYPSWVLYEDDEPVAAIANDNEYEDDVSIRHMETKIKGRGYVEQLIENLLAQGVVISTGKANYNSISPSAYKMINRINEKEYVESRRIGPADNRGKGYKELEGVDVQHYQWKLKEGVERLGTSKSPISALAPRMKKKGYDLFGRGQTMGSGDEGNSFWYYKPRDAQEKQVILEESRQVQTIAFQFPKKFVGYQDIHSEAQLQGILNAFGRGLILPSGQIKLGAIGSSHVSLGANAEGSIRFYWGYRTGEPGIVYIVPKNGMPGDMLAIRKQLKYILSQVFNMLRLSVAPGGLKFTE
jgi:hypothetical protein